MQRIIPCAGILVLLLIAACNNPPESEAEENYHLFLLIGQSNMAGRGVVSEADRIPHSRIKMLDKEGEWVEAIDPLHFDKPIAGVGPGRSFAMAVMEAVIEKHPETSIGLIPSAVGGSPISSWEPGALDRATNTHPYDDALERAKKAMQSGELKAVLWHQGESDSNEESAPLYKEKLVALIHRIRLELGDPALPFLIGQLGQFEEVPWDQWRQMVNNAHEEVAQEMDDVYFISSTGLGHKGDSVHFSAEASHELGKRFALVYVNK